MSTPVQRHIVITPKTQQFWSSTFGAMLSLLIVFSCGIWFGSHNLDFVRTYNVFVLLGMLLTSCYHQSHHWNMGFAMLCGVFHSPMVVLSWNLWSCVMIQNVWGIMAAFMLTMFVALMDNSLGENNQKQITVLRTCLITMCVLTIMEANSPSINWHLFMLCIRLMMFVKLTHMEAISMFQSSRRAEFQNIDHMCSIHGFSLFVCFINLLTGTLQFLLMAKI